MTGEQIIWTFAITVGGGVTITLIVGLFRLLFRYYLHKLEDSKEPKNLEPVDCSASPIQKGNDNTQQVVTGGQLVEQAEGATIIQTTGDVHIHNVETNNYIMYADGVPNDPRAEVRENFKQGQAAAKRGEFEMARRHFQAALNVCEEHTKKCAIHLHIGNTYSRERKYLKAAEHFGISRIAGKKAGDKEGIASALASIGNTYLHRPASTEATQGKNVQEAVRLYCEALDIFNITEYPVQYATTQSNLGIAYTDLPAGTHEKRAENVRKAITCYKEALEIYKKTEYPVQYAMTQNNLGTAYTDLPAGTHEERAENVRKVIACYKEALEIYKKTEYPVDYAMTQNNLGAAYTYLPAGTPEERAENVRKTIACYKEALEIYKKTEYPVQYAATQNNLGAAYGNLLAETPEEKAENVRKAIACYKEALEIRKKTEYPVQYATTQNNLGAVYGNLPAGTPEERAENARKTIVCFNEALEIYKKTEYPQKFCLTAANLGMALLDIGEKDEARKWLSEAWSLRQFLPDQGERIKKLLDDLPAEE